MVEPNKTKKTLASIGGQGNPLKEVNNSLVFKARPGSNSSKRLPSRGEMKDFERSDGFASGSSGLALNILNLGQDENAFASTVKIDLMQIQDEINKLDYDGRLRASLQSADFSKGHISSLKKWLTSISDWSGNFKDLLEYRVSDTSEPEKVFDIMKVPSYNEAFRKLYKMIGVLDVLVTKITELEALALIKYDEVFNKILRSTSHSLPRLSQLNAGISVGRFQIMLANLERLVELCSHSSKLAAGEKEVSNIKDSAEFLKNLKTKSDLVNALQNGDVKMGTEAENGLLIKLFQESISKENKLTEEIGMVCQTLEMSKRRIKELELQNQQLQQQKTSHQELKQVARPSSAMPSKGNTGLNQESFLKALEELSQSYTDEINALRLENIESKKKIVDLETDIQAIGQLKDEFEARVMRLNEEKEKIIRSLSKPFSGSKEFEETFESVFLEEFSNMQAGYEKRINNLNEEILLIKRVNRKDVLDVTQALDRERETKSLLLKKLSAYVKI